jgi:ApeA N-terminal domain 1
VDISGILGDWWLPGHPEGKIAGRLVFNSADGGSLEARGPILGITAGTNTFPAVDQAPLYFERMFGSTEQGDITLLECRVMIRKSGIGSTIAKQHLTCSTVIAGLHAGSHHGFSRARAQIVNLDEWAPLAAIRADGKFGFSFTHNPALSVLLQPGINLELQPTISSGQDRCSAHIEAHTQYYLELEVPSTFEQILMSWVQPFVDLVILATAHPSTVRKLELNDGDPEAPWYEVGMLQGSGADTKTAPIWADQALLRFSDLDPMRRIPQWYSLTHRLRGIFNYTFGARYSVDTPETRFLNATTAAEAIHRELVLPTRKSMDFNDPIVQAFIQNFPEDERKLLGDRMKHLNETSFHQRVEEIYDTSLPFSGRLAPNKDHWITLIKKTRNALTHQSGTLSDKLPSGDRLSVLAESMFILISIYILTELEYSSLDIDEWLRRQQRVKFTVELLLASFPELGSQ